MGEQQQEQQPAPVAEGGLPTRDELIAAVREAGGTASVDVEGEERAAAERAETAGGTATPAEGQTPAGEQPPGEEEPRIAAILKAREKAAAEREAARNHAQEMIQQAQQQASRMLEEARLQAQREFQADLERRRQEFHASPTSAIRALGDPQAIVDAVLKDGTPEGRAIQQLQRELAETKQQAGTTQQLRQEIEQMRAQVRADQETRLIEQVRTQFMGEHASKDKAPYLHARYDENQIFAEANRVAANWRNGGMVLGKDFDFADVAQYLEREAKNRLQPLLSASTPAQQVSAGAPAKEPGNAPKVLANVPRTLSAAQGSERRTSPKPLHEMSPAEQREALMAEVAAARRANPDATS